jgi:hypothetical protein
MQIWTQIADLGVGDANRDIGGAGGGFFVHAVHEVAPVSF